MQENSFSEVFIFKYLRFPICFPSFYIIDYIIQIYYMTIHDVPPTLIARGPKLSEQNFKNTDANSMPHFDEM